MTSNFFDSVTEAINGGVSYADRKTQIIRYRSELSTLARQKAQAFSDLGQAVLNREAANPQFVNAYASQVSAIRSLEQRENELKMQIDALQQQDVASNAGGQPQSGKVCSHCGTHCPDRASSAQTAEHCWRRSRLLRTRLRRRGRGCSASRAIFSIPPITSGVNAAAAAWNQSRTPLPRLVSNDD